MTVYVIRGGYLEENTYLLLEGKEALIVDPGVSAEVILRECERLGASPIGVLLTHGHVDHIFGAPGLQRAGLKIYAHSEEFSVISGRANLALALRITLDSFLPDVALEDGALLELGPFCVRVIFTPGHTKGGVCYLIGDSLFTGDTLFKGSYGRTDFPTGDEMDLLCSIVNVLFELPHETKVYAGHSGDASEPFFLAVPARPDTTIGDEYSTNPILNLL